MNSAMLFLLSVMSLAVASANTSSEVKKLGQSSKIDVHPIAEQPSQAGLDVVSGTPFRSEVVHSDNTATANSQFRVSRMLSASDVETRIIDARKNLRSGDVEQYTPTPVTEAECHVEYEVTQRVPGRCIRLPGDRSICQAGVYLGVDSQCG